MTRHILYHLSHCSSTKPDGWSGAPGEATWVRSLVPRIAARLAPHGVDVFTVDGDLLDHPAFHDPSYESFTAPHYESDTHGDHARGWLWGRAAGSPTAKEDDKLGAIFESQYRALCAATNGPAEHPDWSTVNITDYYGFRLDRAVPGILIEHGIGNGADHDWLRSNLESIAAAHAAMHLQYMGITLPGGDDMFTDADRALLTRVKDLLEAEEPKVWVARQQRGLDVERGTPFSPAQPTIDPRIKQ